jgi:N-acetylglucosaminyldiphosphoundecaprenol N-acetyl-beta-D-mannosaminyltransferase
MPESRDHWGLAADSGQCRLCSSSESQRYFWPEVYAGSGQQLRRCGYCAGVYLAPGFTEAGLSRFYEERYRQLFSAEVPWLSRARFFAWHGDRATARDRLSLIVSALAPGAHLFEMGSGFGAFLGEAQVVRPDLRLAASEPDHTHRAALLGQASVQFFDSLASLAPSSLDAVVAFHVLEHLIDPRGFLEQAARALRADGRLWVEVPDLMADWRTRLFIHPAHLSYFSADTLSRLAEAAGLQVIVCGRHPLASLADNVWLVARRAPQLSFSPVAPAEQATIVAVDKWIERVGWNAKDRIKDCLKRIVTTLLGPGLIGELQRWRQHRARTRADQEPPR